MEGTEIEKRLKAMSNMIIIEPLGYLDFLCLMAKSAIVFTDSGGIQEETTILGVPCMTLRENTERPVTITEGTNHLVHITTADILNNYRQIKKDTGKRKYIAPRFWDGKAAEKIVEITYHAHIKRR
jgi:UDP-N-acetylglucosamine 2-epimerase (non-hydrolysing)